jgi:hypothetical protein
MGVGSFFNKLLTDEALKSLLAEQELYSSYPLWTFIAFALEVIGSIGLLMKKRANLHFIFRLAIIIQMIHTLFFFKSQVYGAAQKSCLH